MNQENVIKQKKQHTKIGAVIVLIISAAVFLPVGGAVVFQAIFNTNKAPVFGSFDGKKIKYEPGSDFMQAAANLADMYQQYGYNLTYELSNQPTDMSYYRIFTTAFAQTVMNSAFSKEVEYSGYKVPAAAIDRAILPAFTDENGKFSKKLYNQISDADLNTMRLNSEKNLVYSRYVDDLFGTGATEFNGKPLYGLKSAAAEESFISSLGEEKHSFNMVTFDTGDYPKEEAVKFGKENSDKFIKYSLSAITAETESEAKAILKQIQNTEITFEDAVSEKSQKYYTGSDGKITTSYGYQLVSMIPDEKDRDAVKALSKDSLSSVIKTSRGYTIFRADTESEQPDFTKTETADAALSYIKANEKGTIETYYSEQAANFAADAAVNGFDSACKKFSLTKTDVPAFSLNYGNSTLVDEKAGASVAGLTSILTNENALKSAFALKVNGISEPLILGSNIVVLQCTGIQTQVAENTDSLAARISQADQSCAQQLLMRSDRVVDNTFQTYIQNFMNLSAK